MTAGDVAVIALSAVTDRRLEIGHFLLSHIGKFLAIANSPPDTGGVAAPSRDAAKPPKKEQTGWSLTQPGFREHIPEDEM